MNLRRYNKDLADEWNRFIASSKNGTFLFDRNFMDYHADRFVDASLLFYEGSKLMAVLPANLDASTNTVYSHQGLTYGGLVMSYKLKASGVMEIFDLMLRYMRDELHAERLVYKPTPYIYSKYASEEDLYALFRHEANLTARGLSTCVELDHRIPFAELRKRNLRKAADIIVRETDDVQAFWNILNDVLTTAHNTHPVHSVSELQLLMSRFPKQIRLFGAYSPEGRLLAGTLVFVTENVVHTQYLASSSEGKSLGALDKIISALISDIFQSHRYLDFGISTEQGGSILNEGLVFQKEGFGGRGICYDAWEIILK